jgi:secreted trypsin-like serine protease
MVSALRAAIAVLLACGLVPSSALGAAAHKSVVNGRTLRVPGYMAFVVAVDDRGVDLCGGTAIRPNVVLTAAHCLVDPRNAFIGADGLHTLFGLDDPWGAIQGRGPLDDNAVAEYVTPRNYGVHRNGVSVNDIALLRLRDAAPATVPVLPSGQARIAGAGRASVVIGWGAESGRSNTNSSSLRRADLTIQPTGYCGRFFREFDGSIMLCAQGRNQTACHGDSGGPLLVSGPARRVYVAGVVSFGAPDCPTRLPGFFANVSRGPLARFVSQQATRLQRKADAEAPAPPAPTPVPVPVPAPVAPVAP